MAVLCRMTIQAGDSVSSLQTEWEGDPSALAHREALEAKPRWVSGWLGQSELSRRAPSALALLRAEALLDFGAPDLPGTSEERALTIESERRALGIRTVPTCEAVIVISVDGKMEWRLDVPALGEDVDGDAVVSFVRNVIRDAIKAEIAKS